MATNKRLGKKLPDWVRREDTAGTRIDSGPFIGIVKNNIDPARSGRLQVWIPDLGGDENNPKNWRTVGYASPFMGTTFQPAGASGSKNTKFSEVANTYGMWAVPPDVGNQVLCTFVAGDPNRGYWFGCINSSLSHYMMPGMAAGNVVDPSQSPDSIKKSYDPTQSFWPVAEFNENVEENFGLGYINNKKPPHDYQVALLIDQGLDRDPIRGAIGSSSQRESPSTVFGISTPGRAVNDPASDPAYQEKLKAGTLTEADTAVRSRKGGHQFVMDDGDVRGAHQLIRLRTAGGHQVLMNDAEHVLYIANSDGSAWLEFTGGGHINAYSSSGINVRTEGDLNLHADRDINMHSGGNVRINAGASISSQTSVHTTKATTSYSMDVGQYSLLSKGAIGLEGSTVSVNTSGELVLKGSKIQLNSKTPAALKTVTNLTTYKQDDVSWNADKGIYVKTAEVFESIATITPSHEPWDRKITNELQYNPVNDLFTPPVKETKQSSVCEPQIPASGNARSVQVFGSTNEAMLESALAGYGISDSTEFAAIMAQCSHESGGFKYVRELGNDAYFSKYDGRADLGNTQPGDGLKFKGRGFIQITGRDIYSKAGAYLGIDLIGNPALAEDSATAAKLVLFFFFEYKKTRTATLNWGDCTAVTRLVNGGTNGLTDRQARFTYYKQKYANGVPTAGGTPSNVVTTGSGGVLVDGSGNPVTTGSNKLDPGPEHARGKSIVDAAPYVVMTREDAPTPSAIASASGVPGLIATQVKAMMLQIGYYESSLNYDDIDSSVGQIGRYHINTLLLKEYGYTNGKDIFTSANWLGKDGITSADDWTNNPGIQEKVMEQIVNDYYTKLVANGGLKSTDDVCTVSGMISTAYFFRDFTRGLLTGGAVDQARFWREQATQTNKQGVSGEVPYNQGRYAVDILSLQGAVMGPKSGNPSGGDSTSGIDPQSVINFGTGSGDYSHYQKLGSDIKTSVEKMAAAFKAATGRKLSINSAFRSFDEQQEIYNKWLAAGGTKSNPSAGGFYMPAKPSATAPHARGIAFDLSRADIADLDRLGLLGKYSFTFPFPVNDPVHIQFTG
jgi:predicted chitinase